MSEATCRHGSRMTAVQSSDDNDSPRFLQSTTCDTRTCHLHSTPPPLDDAASTKMPKYFHFCHHTHVLVSQDLDSYPILLWTSTLHGHDTSCFTLFTYLFHLSRQRRLNEWKDNEESKGMRVNMNKTKVMISGERLKVRQKAVRCPCGVCSKGVTVY